jgi:urease accessory protein
MNVICSTCEHSPAKDEEIVILMAERVTLAKRRWRGVARDGREFGFDVDHALSDGAVFHREEGKCYMISQAPEPILEIDLARDPGWAAAVAWQIGNLHFPLEVTDSAIRCADDPATRQLLDREQIAWRAILAVFRPLTAAGHAHHHH